MLSPDRTMLIGEASGGRTTVTVSQTRGERVGRLRSYTRFALPAVALLVAFIPDEPRSSVAFRDRGSVTGGLTTFRGCLPVTARNIIANYDHIRATKCGTFTYIRAYFL
jgi:hypothetical protein